MLYLSGMLVEALKRRANDFIELAVEMMGRGKHDIAAFLTEQSCQLRVRASLLRLFGDAPPTHGLRHLLGLLARGLEEAGRGICHAGSLTLLGSTGQSSQTWRKHISAPNIGI